MKALAAALAAMLAGCASVGPPTIARDRFDYVESISSSWKSQMLLNLVKVRYGDVPVFLDVTSVINAYGFETQATLQGQVTPTGRAGDTFIGASGSGTYSDKPTITYAPLTGDKFAKSVMSPVPVSGILLLVQSGYPADIVLRICASSINGLENARGGPNPRPGSSAFYELLSLLREDQLAGGIAFEARPGEGKKAMALVLRKDADEAMARRHRRIRELLGISAEERELDVGYGGMPSGTKEIAILTRSMLQIMLDVSSHFEVPEREMAEGRVTFESRSAEQQRMYPPIVKVRVSAEKPADSFVAVPYRGQWYWIDDRDPQSKKTFTFLMLMFSLTETGTTQAAPVLTVPAR